MHVHNTLQAISKLNINSPEDLNIALNSSELDQQKISRFADEISEFSHVQTPYYLCLSSIFKETYQNSLGFPAVREVINELDGYNKLLEHSISVYNDVLTPLFIRSLNCHRAALCCFVTEDNAGAAAAMAETKEIAQQVASTCQDLSQEFHSLRDREVKILCALSGVRAKIYQKLREVGANSAKLKPILDLGIDQADKAINSLGKTVTVLANVCLFLKMASSHSDLLADTDLAYPECIELLQEREAGKLDPDDERWIAEAQTKVQNAVSHIDLYEPQPTTLTEVVKSMKTGRNILQQPNNSRLKDYFDNVKSRLSNNLEEEFEDSYLKWAALAKSTQTMATATRDGLADVTGILNEINQETDPLAMALREMT